MRLDTAGISSRDWETYPVLRFSEVPEIAVELIAPPPTSAARRRRSDAAARPSPRSATPCARARRPHPRPAADPRAGDGGVAEGVNSVRTAVAAFISQY